MFCCCQILFIGTQRSFYTFFHYNSKQCIAFEDVNQYVFGARVYVVLPLCLSACLSGLLSLQNFHINLGQTLAIINCQQFLSLPPLSLSTVRNYAHFVLLGSRESTLLKGNQTIPLFAIIRHFSFRNFSPRVCGKEGSSCFCCGGFNSHSTFNIRYWWSRLFLLLFFFVNIRRKLTFVYEEQTLGQQKFQNIVYMGENTNNNIKLCIVLELYTIWLGVFIDNSPAQIKE